jgi:hypothetical protein
VERPVFLYHGEIKYSHNLMKTYILIDITTESTKPSLNIPRFVQTSSASKAALIFMSRAFSRKNEKISASIRIQNEIGNVKRFNARRSSILSNTGPTKYKHYIL